MIVLKITLFTILTIILIQDFKDQKVYWFLFPMVGVLSGILFYSQTLPIQFTMAIVMNLIFVFVLLTTIFIYTKLILKSTIKSVIGSGDILLFMVLIFTFSTISFIVLLTCSLIFALIMHLLLNKRYKVKTVPLAGYMCGFFSITYLAFWLGFIDSIYII